jgi:hypothetical protein
LDRGGKKKDFRKARWTSIGALGAEMGARSVVQIHEAFVRRIATRSCSDVVKRRRSTTGSGVPAAVELMAQLVEA